ncbi:GvpL/GvpF family gas vesicle protein [Rhodococcus olei]|uniref:GvpL/GvpF family gas vesicle protein n=2 Tax=Rhodococcus olei TaxID=2161675 RepID=A0ABP8PKC8_9NOCA
MVDDGTGVWMYAVVGEGPLSGLPAGVAGERPRAIEAAGLTAIVGTVGLDEFGEAALRRNLEDLDWLEVVARAHDRVVAAVAHTTDTVPLRLATVCRDDDRVRTLLAERRREFDAALRQITGRAEWGVRAIADTTAPPDRDAATDTTAGAGARYLARRRTELSYRETVEREVEAEADGVHDALLRIAVAGRRQPATAPVLVGTRAWMPLNGTYLVDRSRAGEFAEAVTALDESSRRLRLDLTGPWPPYSFTGIDGDSGEEPS